ncbi:MAG: transcription-repair coupling factor [Verrucomicrobiia bacterium]
MQALAERIGKGGALSLAGIGESAQPFFAALVRHLLPDRALVVVAAGVKKQESLDQDIATWLRLEDETPPEKNGAHRTQRFYYPAWEVLPHDAKLPHADVISERLETLTALAHPTPGNPQPPIIVTSVAALMQRTFASEEIARRTRPVRRGDRIDPLDLVEWLEDQGYEPEAKVTQKGEISLRGGILDIYPMTSPWPVRLEFFGDELESLRQFDPATQISRGVIDAVTLPPGGELALLKQASMKDAAASIKLASLIDHLPPTTVFLLCDPDDLDQQADAYAQQVAADDPFFLSWNALLDQLRDAGMTSVAVSGNSEDVAWTGAEVANGEADQGAETAVDPALTFKGLEAFRPLGDRAPEPQIAEAQRREFFAQLHRWMRQGYSVHVFCNNDGERQRFLEIWRDYGLATEPEPTLPEAPSNSSPNGNAPETALGAISRGFLFEAAKIVVVTDAEVFGRYKIQRPRRLKSPHAAAARSALDIDFTDLDEGDFVVHLQHGIGRYLGLQVLPAGAGRKDPSGALRPSATPGKEPAGQECLVIEYAAAGEGQAAPRLYVPVTEAHLVSKYVGAGKARPALNTLGGTRWVKAKAQAERAVRDLAAELLSIQAARESQAGHAFPPDAAWQREFEAAFVYEETPDQMRAILETKADMEAARPMDRLICGDVGYGKTEVAIRAAFKAVLDGKQVALLVPTTILAEQHFHSFRERMADYPIRVEQLSRFCTPREQRRVLRQLADGSVDIVIGTHRLIQEDVAFKELGLVIIDEEQRFGVMHKEKFKLLRKLVDVLTLSATPIPRTLYLALTGARDMSTIETPPQDRLPIETVVAQYDERIIRDAIQRELNRQGQVYYLHNRVMDIHSVALRIAALVPKARIVVGHGQMDSGELEEVMAKFVNGEADVLVSTTIIESGIDIPNANTIIIDRADRFGLSDLYQLRGRVGRYKHQAYAYLLLPRHAALLSDVRKRISAIRQYSSLGSGFKIAMRDLEIRGAGNLLGAEQSGHITAVGFELYCQLLKQSVSALKGEKVRPRVEVELRLDFLALHPGDGTGTQKSAPPSKRQRPDEDIHVPREVATYTTSRREAEETSEWEEEAAVKTSAAYVPFSYIKESHQRIEVYRKLAQATDKQALEQLRAELRDRYGKVPEPVELLIAVTELKPIAAERGVTSIQTRGDKIMLMRNGDYFTMDGKFPRLVKRDAKGRVREIKRLLLALGTVSAPELQSR